MSVISKRTMKSIEESINSGIRTIFVEGPADICLYKRFYNGATFRHFGSSDRIIEAVKKCNSKLGKTPLVVGIIDRDDKIDEEAVSLAEENIFMMKEREIESIFLRQDIIEGLFDEAFFIKFSQEICAQATNRSGKNIDSYQEALDIIKKQLSSKYSVRMLLKIAKMKNKGNKDNIDYLISLIQEKGLLKIVESIIPKLPDVVPQIVASERKNFQNRLQNFIPSEINSENNTNDGHETNSFEKY